MRLVIQLSNGQVYCIPKDILLNVAHCSSFELHRLMGSSNFATLKDLSTGELLLLSKAYLSQFSVPDEKLGHFIRRFEIRGLSTPYKNKPHSIDPSEIPLHGNVTDPKWASISLGGSCNNHCIFCYTKWIRMVPDLQINQIKDVIDQIAAIGTVKLLVFSGGEATIRQDLVSLFEYANQAGFSDIALQTNGRELRKFELVERLVELGLKSVLLSIHGHNDKVHNNITGSPDSFSETLQGLHNLLTLTVKPTINTVMCKENYKYIIDIAVLLGKILNGFGKLRFSYPIIEGAAYENIIRVIVPFSQLRPLMLTAMQFAEKIGIEAQAANMPLCIPDDSHRNTTYDTAVLSEFVEASLFYKFNIPRGEKSVKLNRCSRCSKVSLCRGIQVEYLRVYPNAIDEFTPIK